MRATEQAVVAAMPMVEALAGLHATAALPADELYSEGLLTLLWAARRWATNGNKNTFETFAKRSVQLRLVTLVRESQKCVAVEPLSSHLPDPKPTVLEQINVSERAHYVLKSFDCLTPSEEWAVTLHHALGYTLSETAGIMGGISIKRVTMLCMDGRAKARRRFLQLSAAPLDKFPTSV